MADPLVTVAVPTFNRAQRLRRAVLALTQQTYRRLEILISDNASDDETREVCAQLAASDSRVRILRNSRNVGPIANHNGILQNATGQLYMVQGDDDWLDSRYVELCVSRLLEVPTVDGAVGRPAMFDKGSFLREGVAMELQQDDSVERVISYFRWVEENTVFHSLMPTNLWRRLPPIPNTMGGDWLHMARVSFCAKIGLVDARICKDVGGSTTSFTHIVSRLSLPPWQGRYWREAIVLALSKDILTTNGVYGRLSVGRRLWLLARLVDVLVGKFDDWKIPTSSGLVEPLWSVGRIVRRGAHLARRAGREASLPGTES